MPEKTDKSKKQANLANFLTKSKPDKKKEIVSDSSQLINVEEKESAEKSHEEEDSETLQEIDAQKEEAHKNLEIKTAHLSKDSLELDEPWFLLSTDYDRASNKALLKFYNPKAHKIEYRLDPTGHEPYFISDLSLEEAMQNETLIRATKRIKPRMEEIEKYYPLKYDDKLAKMLKIYTKTPIDVREARTKVPKAWEARIRYHRNWIYDTQTVPGLLYYFSDEGLQSAETLKDGEGSRIMMDSKVKDALSNYQNLLNIYMPVFTTPIPHMKTAAIDIELDSPMDHFPVPKEAKYKITCVCLVGTDDQHYAFVLDAGNKEESKENYRARWGLRPEGLPKELSIKSFKNEEELLFALFDVMASYPVIVGFNSDKFDFAYIHYRAQKLGIPREDLPLNYNAKSQKAILSGAIHIDLFNWYHNASIKGYAHGGAYKQDSLDAIAKALLGVGKVELDADIRDLPIFDLIHYCWRDTKITLELFTFDDYTPLTLMIILARITRMPLEDLVRTAISNWIQNMFFFEHRRRNMLIPIKEEIQHKGKKAVRKAIIKDKKFMGAYVVDPSPGIHFDVTVLDFSSLYPSIIKERNLSYETINCQHNECKDNKIPGTPHWVCTKRDGIVSELIGFLRDIRVFWLKEAAKKDTPEKKLYDVLQRAFKVLINASYGVLGAEHFALYCLSTAESTTAVGRWAIEQTIKKTEEGLGVKVIYGDTDSVFLLKPNQEQIDELIQWSEEFLGMPLEAEKTYRYCVLSERKKNYFGVYAGKKGDISRVDVKGLSGKKRNTPQFIQEAFTEMLSILAEVSSPEEFEEAKEKIKKIIRSRYRKLEKKEYTVEDLAFTVQMTKPIHSYTVKSQHVKAAQILIDQKKRDTVEAGEIIRFLKVKEDPGVMPIQLADPTRIDVKAYKAQLDSVFEQVIGTLDISLDELHGKVSLAKFFN